MCLILNILRNIAESMHTVRGSYHHEWQMTSAQGHTFFRTTWIKLQVNTWIFTYIHIQSCDESISICCWVYFIIFFHSLFEVRICWAGKRKLVYSFYSRFLHSHSSDRVRVPSENELILKDWGKHDDVIKLKLFRCYWPFVREIHLPPVNSPHKGQWRRALIFSLICAWINGWVNNREAGDLRRHRAHYDVIVMTE